MHAERTSILFVDPETAELNLPALRTRFEVTSVASEEQAVRALRAFKPTVVITELALSGGHGVAVVRQAKAFAMNPPSVLVTSASPECVPDALVAGCDGVLVKPFAPNLLFARIGLLLKRREQAGYFLAGTNTVWPDTRCPSCAQGGVVSFDAAGRLRLWYACLPCRKVWVGPQQPVPQREMNDSMTISSSSLPSMTTWAVSRPQASKPSSL